jgi:hypothetical protein
MTAPTASPICAVPAQRRALAGDRGLDAGEIAFGGG